MLVRGLKGDYYEIVSRAILFSTIPINECAKAVVKLLREMKCNIAEDALDCITDCMWVFQQCSGPDELDGELMARLLYNLHKYIIFIQEKSQIYNKEDFQQAVNAKGQKIVSRSTLANLEVFFASIKEDNVIVITSDNIYALLMPIILITTKAFEECAVRIAYVFELREYKRLMIDQKPVPDKNALYVLERIVFSAISEKKPVDSEDQIIEMSFKYFFAFFTENLSRLTFYPQPRTQMGSKGLYRLNRVDIEELIEDSELQGIHSQLLSFVGEVATLSCQFLSVCELLRMIKVLKITGGNVIDEAADEIKSILVSRDKLQEDFVKLFSTFQGLVDVKMRPLLVTQRVKRLQDKIPSFVRRLKRFLNDSCWQYPDSADKEILAINAMILKYKTVFAQSKSDEDLYLEAVSIAKKEALTPDLPDSEYAVDLVFGLHGAICNASESWLDQILKFEKKLPTFVTMLHQFLKYDGWKPIVPISENSQAIITLLAKYQKVFDVPNIPRVLYRLAVTIAEEEQKALRSKMTELPTIFHLCKTILNCDVEWLSEVLRHETSLVPFVEGLSKFLSKTCWSLLDVTKEDEKALSCMLNQYRSFCELKIAPREKYELIFDLAQREYLVLQEINANKNKALTPAFDDLWMLHKGILENNFGELSAMIDIWKNRMVYNNFLPDKIFLSNGKTLSFRPFR